MKKRTIKKKTGRKPILLDENQIKEIETLAENLSNKHIAHYFNISESCFYTLRAKDERIERAYRKGKSKGILKATGLLWRNMDAGDTTAIIFYLKTQARWSEKESKEERYRLQINDDKSPTDIINAAVEGLQKGEFTTQEASQISSIANIKANINSQSALETMVRDETESKEQLMAKVYAIKQVIDNQEGNNV